MVGVVLGIMPVPLGCARMLLLLCGTFHFGGSLLRVNTVLSGEKVVEYIGGKLLTQTGTVENGLVGMVDEGRPIDAPRIVGAEYHA